MVNNYIALFLLYQPKWLCNLCLTKIIVYDLITVGFNRAICHFCLVILICGAKLESENAGSEGTAFGHSLIVCSILVVSMWVFPQLRAKATLAWKRQHLLDVLWVFSPVSEHRQRTSLLHALMVLVRKDYGHVGSARGYRFIKAAFRIWSDNGSSETPAQQLTDEIVPRFDG